jgi:hypothetical protein
VIGCNVGNGDSTNEHAIISFWLDVALIKR